MTEAQWLFEYYALRKKEDEELMLLHEVMKVSSTVLRETLVGVLGLSHFVDEEAKPGEPTPFLPAAYLMSNHHLLKAVEEVREKAKKTQAAVQDEAFEALSKQLMTGDMEALPPFLRGQDGVPPENAYWFSRQAREDLARAGVKLRPKSAGTVPHFSRKGVVFKSPEELLAEAQAKEVADEEARTVERIELEPGVFAGE